ncbi:hypothetical protein ACU610_18360 [Geodermatophilus sp. URMC 61]|uniref:hypothetical protein n=1 Tax=Geodermatophilus sp. URMC 61 TaxID=3423411 RepID=UPI00406D4E45
MTTAADRPASTTDRRAAAAAFGGAAISVAVGVTQLLFPQDTLAAIDPRTRVILVGTTVLLWALPVLYLRLGASAAGQWAARVASAGTVLLTVGTLSSAVNGEDLAFFPPVAIAANALWLLGSIGLSVSLWRAGRVPRAVALLVPAVVLGTIFLSQLGGGILAGAYLAAVGSLLVRGRLDRRA